MTDSTPGPDRGFVARGAIAGIAGATILVLWFLIVDGLAGQPFRTPAFLFRVLAGGQEIGMVGAQVTMYTVVHFAAFLAIGIAAAWLVRQLRVATSLLAGAVLGFLLFDLLFYGSVWLTGVDVVEYLGWAEVLVGNVLAGIGLFGALQLTGAGDNVSWAELLAEHEVLREGVVAGLIGAAAVAAWFLLIDMISGRLLFTPAALGSIVFSGATGVEDVQVNALIVIGYTGLHVAAFLATGLVAAGLAAIAEDRQPYVIFGAVLLFVTFETFFIGLVTIAAQWLLEVIPWWTIMVANIIAAASMGYYLWKRHPDLVDALSRADLEDSGRAPERAVEPGGLD